MKQHALIVDRQFGKWLMSRQGYGQNDHSEARPCESDKRIPGCNNSHSPILNWNTDTVVQS